FAAGFPNSGFAAGFSPFSPSSAEEAKKDHPTSLKPDPSAREVLWSSDKAATDPNPSFSPALQQTAPQAPEAPLAASPSPATAAEPVASVPTEKAPLPTSDFGGGFAAAFEAFVPAAT